MHVDGFRFDLATVLGREKDCFFTDAGFFAAVHQDPVLAGVKLIAEPWTLVTIPARWVIFPWTGLNGTAVIVTASEIYKRSPGDAA
jgi:glycogen operon protein